MRDEMIRELLAAREYIDDGKQDIQGQLREAREYIDRG